MALLYLSLFTASSAGSLTDDLLDRRLGTALLSAIAYFSGFIAVLQWAMPEISHQSIGLAVACLMGLMWDVWSNRRSVLAVWRRGADADDEAVGVVLMLGARLPAYAFPALIAQSWIS